MTFDGQVGLRKFVRHRRYCVIDDRYGRSRDVSRCLGWMTLFMGCRREIGEGRDRDNVGTNA